MNKPNLYWLKNKSIEKDILLDKVNDGKFRVLEFGKFQPILCGGILIDNSIAEVFQKYVPEQIGSINKVIIWRKSTAETWANYSEIQIKNHLDLKTFKSAKFDGFRIHQLYYDAIYISSDLKDKLISECEKVNELEFINERPLYA
jgi:hypothetical protein